MTVKVDARRSTDSPPATPSKSAPGDPKPGIRQPGLHTANQRRCPEATTSPHAGTDTRPKPSKTLRDICIERYYADLVRMEKVSYARNGESCIERLPISDRPELEDTFDGD